MISATVFVEDGQYTGVVFSGHAGHDKDPVEGQALVCSAVSALSINMVNSIEHFTGDSFEADMDETGGNLDFHFTAGISPESKLLMNSFILGIQDIEEAYGEPYIKICFKEV